VGRAVLALKAGRQAGLLNGDRDLLPCTLTQPFMIGAWAMDNGFPSPDIWQFTVKLTQSQCEAQVLGSGCVQTRLVCLDGKLHHTGVLLLLSS
jgi:hypothetical protein